MWRFEPILKPTIWGGRRIAPFKGLRQGAERVGESWELSGVEGCESVVADGPEAGLSLSDLLHKYGPAVLGERNYKKFGDRFPLLVKFIDAEEDLSVQVHPGDEMAVELGQINGKSEMWYILEAGRDSRLALGLNRSLTPAEFEALCVSDRIEDVLNYVHPHPDDVYLVPAGRIHAIGAKVMLIEIQQTSDASFRIYDYHRTDADGRERELHIQQARRAVNLDDTDCGPVPFVAQRDIPINVVRRPYFTTNIMVLEDEVMRDYAELDSFVVLIVAAGSGRLICGADAVANEPTIMDVHQGETILVSASARGLTIIPGESGMKLLETYVG